MEKYKDLSDQIWTTRISRVNAEKRLVNKEAFFQGINIYYSCVTIIFSILTLLNNNEKLSLMTVFMTISLLIVILYLNGQKYSEQAREYRKNYTELQKLAVYRKDVEKCIQLIKEVLMESKKPWKMVESPLYYRYVDTVQGKSFSGVGNNFVHALATEIENKEEYEFLKGNKELEAIFSQYLK